LIRMYLEASRSITNLTETHNIAFEGDAPKAARPSTLR
jgi:hypothetical protein